MTKTFIRTDGVVSEEIDIQEGVEKGVTKRKPRGGIEIEQEKVFKTSDLDLEQFMAQELEVFINEPNNDNDPQFLEVTVGGDYRCLVRGETHKLRRSHVAVLARAKQSRIRQVKVVNPDGSAGFREDNVLSLSYPFSIVSDPAGKKGIEWIKKLLSNPAS